MFASTRICASIPSSWSRNHQAEPHCIFPGTRPVLEVADHRGHQLVVGGVQVVEDRLRELVGLVEAVEEARERPRLLEVADRVEAGVGAEAPCACACCCCAGRRGGTAAPSRARGRGARGGGGGRSGRRAPRAASRACPPRSRSKSSTRSRRPNGSASSVSRPWSDARQPSSWKAVWRFSSAARSSSQRADRGACAAFSSFPTHAVHAARSSTSTALSGRHVG